MKLLDGDPRWTHRRRLVYLSALLSVTMIGWGAWVWRDGIVASELVRSGTALLTVILTSYVFAGALDDKWQRADDEPSDF